MGIRVTDAMLMRTALADVNRVRQRLAELQEQAASGLRINRPSDDPVGTSAAMLLRAGIDATARFQGNADLAGSRLAATEGAVANAQNVLVKLKQLAIQGANDTNDASARRDLAKEVEGLHAQLLVEANAQAAGSYLFGGFASNTVPFVASGPFVDSPPSSPTVSFQGDSNEIQVEIDQGVRVRSSADGRRVFLGDGNGDGVPDPGREDLFDVTADLRDALMANDGTAVAAVLPRLDNALSQLSAERTGLGTAIQQVETIGDRLAKRTVDLQSRLSQTQDADSVQVFSELVQKESALQAALQATGRLIQPSLLDFLG